MDRKPVGGIVHRQRDSSSFLSIFFFSWNEGYLRRRETLDRTFVFFFYCKLWIYINWSFSLSKNKKSIWKGKEYADLWYKKKKDHTGGGYGGLMLAKAWLSMRKWISLYCSLSRFSLSATYVSLTISKTQDLIKNRVLETRFALAVNCWLGLKCLHRSRVLKTRFLHSKNQVFKTRDLIKHTHSS